MSGPAPALPAFRAALAAELLKARRSRVPLFTFLGFTIAPLVGGLFMVVNKDPERARELGLLGQKAQLVGGADWPTFLGLLVQTVAVGGLLMFAIATAWVFGREFADRTVRTLLAVPVRRGAIVAAKFGLVAGWCAALSLWVFALGLGVGWVVGLPGGSPEALRHAAGAFAAVTLGTIALQSATALVASGGRGYLPPLGWAILTLVLAQIVAALGRGAWFPWAVPALHSGVAGPDDVVGAAGWLLVGATSALGAALTLAWWRRADQAG